MTVVIDLQIVVVEINCQPPLIATRVHSAPDKSTTILGHTSSCNVELMIASTPNLYRTSYLDMDHIKEKYCIIMG
jgi:hypothetical protein